MGAETGSELGLVALGAMLSPTTLTFSVLALVLGPRPFRTGFVFFLGAFGATIAIGIVAAFVLGNHAASHTSTPKTWVAVVDVVLGVLLLAYAIRGIRRPVDEAKMRALVEQMSGVASSPAVAVAGAGAMLANPGAYIPIALKAISETDPTPAEYIAEWVAFTVVALLPLICALVLLVIARGWTERLLGRARSWLERRALTVAYGIGIALALVLIGNGVTALAS